MTLLPARTAPRLGLLLTGILFSLSSASAEAGTYDVVACGGAAGGAQNSFLPGGNAGMAAYSVCPNTPSNPATGIVTRASAAGAGGWVPYLAGAYQIFEAPAGASLASVSFDVAALRLASYWTTGIVAYDGDFNNGELPYGCYAGQAGCALGTPAFFGPVTVALNGRARFRFETRCANPAGCDISASGFQPGMRALFSAANVTVRVQDFSPPSVSPSGGSLFSGEWLRGFHSGFSTESDYVGIMVNRTWIDGTAVYSEDFRNAGWPGWVRCDFTHRRPCHDVAGAGSHVNTRALADGTHDLRVEAVDAAGNSGSASRTIRVDNTAPTRVNANVEGGEGWRQANDFTLGWRSTDEQTAPITAVHYSLCKSDGACSSATRSAESGERLTGLRLPGPGDYTLRLWREDQAGNADRDSASDAVRLRFDDAPPEAAFELIDENDPRRLDARVSDAVSGVAGGEIEMRRAGYRQWHPVSTTFRGNRLSAYVDDLAVPDGRYEFRARVRDRATNERLSTLREDGSKMELTLPLRSATRIVLARTKRCRKAGRGRKRRCTTRQRLPARGTVRARLEMGDRRPIPGGAIEILAQPRTGGGFRQVATRRSDERGRFAYKLRRGPSRTLRFHFAGSGRIKPATAAVRVRVPARTTLRVNRTSLRNGESVRFSGRLAGRPIPEGGKLIDLQAHYRGRWRTFATPRSDANGRWRFRYRFGATRGLVRYRFRARVRREAAYPYELGYSRTIAVTVRGP
jgi:hypothetical protein